MAEQPAKLRRDPLTCPGAMGMPLLRGRGAAPWVLSCSSYPDTLEPEKADRLYLRLLYPLRASGSWLEPQPEGRVAWWDLSRCCVLQLRPATDALGTSFSPVQMWLPKGLSLKIYSQRQIFLVSSGGQCASGPLLNWLVRSGFSRQALLMLVLVPSSLATRAQLS